MREIIYATETGADVPQDLVERWNIQVVPMHVVMDNVDYEDGTFPIDDIYNYFERTGKVPTTSATNVHEYAEFFKKIQAEHPGCFIYHFAYTSKASCTYQNAAIAIQDLEDICLIDTLNVSGGQTAVIEESIGIIEARKSSLSSSKDCFELSEELKKVPGRVKTNFIPNTLEYLRAGGRVSNAAFIAASILSLKPRIDMIDGELIATKKYRGKIISWIDKFFKEFLEGENWKKDCLYLMYGKGLPKDVMDRMEENAKKYGFKSTRFVMTGCVVSCHGGKGAVGLTAIRA